MYICVPCIRKFIIIIILSKCHYYSKLKGDAIYTSTCLLGLKQCVEAVDSIKLLDLVFANFTDLKLVPVDSGLVTPDTYHPPFSIDVLLPHINNNLNSEFSYRIYSAGNSTLLYNILSTHDWSSVYETTSVDTAVASLNAAVRGAMEQQFLVAIAASPNSLPGSPTP
jgi:hypothetical protein